MTQPEALAQIGEHDLAHARDGRRPSQRRAQSGAQQSRVGEDLGVHERLAVAGHHEGEGMPPRQRRGIHPIGAEAVDVQEIGAVGPQRGTPRPPRGRCDPGEPRQCADPGGGQRRGEVADGHAVHGADPEVFAAVDRPDEHLMPAVEQGRGRMPHMLLHPTAVGRERGADQSDPAHPRPRLDVMMATSPVLVPRACHAAPRPRQRRRCRADGRARL